MLRYAHKAPLKLSHFCRTFQAPPGGYNKKKPTIQAAFETVNRGFSFGALEGTRIPGPLIKSQMLYRLSYERIFRSKTILPNNITTIDCKKQEQRRKKRKFPRKRPDLRRERFSGAQHSAEAGARRL